MFGPKILGIISEVGTALDFSQVTVTRVYQKYENSEETSKTATPTDDEILGFVVTVNNGNNTTKENTTSNQMPFICSYHLTVNTPYVIS